MANNRMTTWYAEPRDEYTNRTFAERLSEENFCLQKLCADGKRRDMWCCPHYLIEVVEGAGRGNGNPVRLKIFIQHGITEKPRFWRFHDRRPRSRSIRKVRAV
jgi:hypothetical protein